MIPSSRRRLPLPVLVATIVVLVALVASACSSKPPPSVAASVNGSEITDPQLRASVPLFEFLAELQGAVCGQTGATPPTANEQKAACTRQVLGSMIQETVLKSYADENDITVSQDQIDGAIAQITQGGSPEQIEAGLKESGLTMADFEGLVRRLLLYSNVEKSRLAEEYDEAELRKLYEDRKVALTTISAKHILVETKEQAKKIKAQATPENFAELAAKFSGDPGSAENGGDLGTTQAGTFVPEFAAAAVKAEPGQIVGPVRTDFGYHVIYLVSKDTPTFEEARGDLVEGSQESALAFQEWLNEQLAGAKITVNPRYGTWDGELGTVVAITSTNPSATSLITPSGPPVGEGEAPAEVPAEAPAEAPADAPAP